MLRVEWVGNHDLPISTAGVQYFFLFLADGHLYFDFGTCKIDECFKDPLY